MDIPWKTRRSSNIMISHALLTQKTLITRLSPFKVTVESTSFLERIQADLCGPIHLLADHLHISWSSLTHLLDGLIYVSVDP